MTSSPTINGRGVPRDDPPPESVAKIFAKSPHDFRISMQMYHETRIVGWTGSEGERERKRRIKREREREREGATPALIYQTLTAPPALSSPPSWENYLTCEPRPKWDKNGTNYGYLIADWSKVLFENIASLVRIEK